ncbi:MAG: hypothetical protein PSX36_03400 [bacterium]|nr:hypothetical protein [bacterium]
MGKTSLTFDFGSMVFEDRILIVTLNEDLEITESILEKIFTEGAALSRGVPYSILADVRKNVSSTSSARKYGAHHPFMKQLVAQALIADTSAVIILANFFIKVNKPEIPTRLFKKKEDAIAWLRSTL